MSDAAPVGRPTKYLPEYCERVIIHMAEGASLTSFAADISVSRSTLNIWMEAEPEFFDAVKIGKAKCAAWWEKRGREIALKGGGQGSATLAIFGMKNMGSDDWQEKQQHDHTLPAGTIGGVAIFALPDNDRDKSKG